MADACDGRDTVIEFPDLRTVHLGDLVTTL